MLMFVHAKLWNDLHLVHCVTDKPSRTRDREIDALETDRRVKCTHSKSNKTNAIHSNDVN